jgi:hypothetical protein
MNKTILVLKTFFLSFMLFSFQSLLADSECKGLSQSQCKANPDCTSVSGYTTKDGRKVDDYCRAKSGKGADDKADKKNKKNKKDKVEGDKTDVKEKKNKKHKKDKVDDKADKKNKTDKK